MLSPEAPKRERSRQASLKRSGANQLRQRRVPDRPLPGQRCERSLPRDGEEAGHASAGERRREIAHRQTIRVDVQIERGVLAHVAVPELKAAHLRGDLSAASDAMGCAEARRRPNRAGPRVRRGMECERGGKPRQGKAVEADGAGHVQG